MRVHYVCLCVSVNRHVFVHFVSQLLHSRHQFDLAVQSTHSGDCLIEVYCLRFPVHNLIEHIEVGSQVRFRKHGLLKEFSQSFDLIFFVVQ